jgi:hypothetical protein
MDANVCYAWREVVMSARMIKYPRTRHLSGSELQRDDTPDTVPFRELAGVHLVVEEKLDGANAAVRFHDGELLLQSRGHFLQGGPRERHFALLKTWASCHQGVLREVLGHRYVMFGEWLYAKHTVFYDLLPHYFHEFDVYDLETERFLSTPARRALLHGLPVVSVPVLHEGPVPQQTALLDLVGPSLYKSADWRQCLRGTVVATGQSWPHVERQTEHSDLAEGLYVKHEDAEQVLARMKYVRPGFVQTLLDGDGHWQQRPILPNQLAPGVDLFGRA